MIKIKEQIVFDKEEFEMYLKELPKYSHLSSNLIENIIRFSKWMKQYESIELVETLKENLFLSMNELSKVACKLNDDLFLKNIQIEKAFRTLNIYLTSRDFNHFQKAIIYKKFEEYLTK